jgi:hypothetical protein
MAPHQERVVAEKAELDVKLEKLGAFFETDQFKSINQNEQKRMAEQWDVMKKYSDILGARIAAF